MAINSSADPIQPQPLTARQNEILRYIEMQIAKHGYPPTIREIGANFGIRSTNGVNDHIQALRRKGYITQQEQKSRSLQITRTHFQGGRPHAGTVFQIPLYDGADSLLNWPFCKQQQRQNLPFLASPLWEFPMSRNVIAIKNWIPGHTYFVEPGFPKGAFTEVMMRIEKKFYLMQYFRKNEGFILQCPEFRKHYLASQVELLSGLILGYVVASFKS